MIKKSLLFFTAFIALFLQAFGQLDTRQQYFDGNDTIASKTLDIVLDTSDANIWQVGPPQKILFDAAATAPNVIITDTINNIPVNNVSRFYLRLNTAWWQAYGILAIRWKQKLDMSHGQDGGIVEYSTDTGTTWKNIFASNEVHNLYGFNTINVDTLAATGDIAFTGTDTTWRDVWLCFKYNVLSVYDSVIVRYTLYSDSADSTNEGWMIDNMMAHVTYVHTVAGKNPETENGLLVYPTITNGLVHIDIPDDNVLDEVKDITVLNMEGKVLQRMNKSGARNQVDLSGYPDGHYLLQVTKGKETYKYRLVLSH